MPSYSKPAVRNMSHAKRAALITLLLIVIALGLFLGAFVHYRLNNKTYSATFVTNDPSVFQSAA